MAAGTDGTAVLAWRRDGNIEAAIKPAGAESFAAPVTLGAATSSPSVAVDDQGRAVVAWDGGDDVMIAERPPGGVLGAATLGVDATAADRVAVALKAAGRSERAGSLLGLPTCVFGP